MDVDELIEALENAGYDAGAYSGRAMFGKECVSVQVDDDGDLWALANEIGLAGIEVPRPRTDSLGLGIVVYWPTAKWPETTD